MKKATTVELLLCENKIYSRVTCPVIHQAGGLVVHRPVLKVANGEVTLATKDYHVTTINAGTLGTFSSKQAALDAVPALLALGIDFTAITQDVAAFASIRIAVGRVIIDHNGYLGVR